jgi:hypothetical protein
MNSDIFKPVVVQHDIMIGKCVKLLVVVLQELRLCLSSFEVQNHQQYIHQQSCMLMIGDSLI